MRRLLTDLLFNSENNLDSSGYQLLFQSGVKVNKSTFIDRLHQHPDYPSLLSVKDTFESFGMDSLAVRIKSESSHKKCLEIPVERDFY